MRVLLDEQLPRRLSTHLTVHEVSTVQQQGWAGVKNGDLLRQAEAAGFDVFVTADRNLEFQQNLESASLRIVVLVAVRITLTEIVPLVPALLEAITTATPGKVVRVSA